MNAPCEVGAESSVGLMYTSNLFTTCPTYALVSCTANRCPVHPRGPSRNVAKKRLAPAIKFPSKKRSRLNSQVLRAKYLRSSAKTKIGNRTANPAGKLNSPMTNGSAVVLDTTHAGGWRRVDSLPFRRSTERLSSLSRPLSSSKLLIARYALSASGFSGK